MRAVYKQLAGAGLILLAGFGLGRLASHREPPAPVAGPGEEGAVLPPPVALQLGGATTRPPSRGFRLLGERDRERLAARIREFQAATDDSGRLEALDGIEASCYGREILGLIRSILAAPAGQMGAGPRSRAIRMLAGNTSAEILPVLALAREDRDEELRIQAVMAAMRVEGEEFEDFIAAAFADKSANVRFAGLDVVDHQPEDVRERLFVRAMLSPRGDVALAGLGELEADATADSIPLIMRGLSAPNDEVREEARVTLEFLLDEEFQGEEQAREWWLRNMRRFDRELNRLD